ncbi:RagB/SusD family nutrient uptake outer membrane protein [Elizabethkingia bruuniana]|uniref:RagB/SusD family nutrient uptake outer membrane protein n=1 Tax=Elizabethkingia bruuniana TaxID=1756149 RepID=A0A7T7V1I6_9FLAO|nr:RagB/SusD family nutrient uptake outer membrane protein [Elizabethkingia bruuniana]KGO10296.1 RagB/SusD family protein [Elizabethkingia miricola]AQX86205.1 RagB/SusD family protein [Elizabethkingia bruuniana]KUY24717.1 RagB/SusD family protein [Elizabethkingia bruuniana]OPB61770.1 RagB/SusD family protein [Elizabethkingia bruuniana]QDZ64473.1 RagB/SusD family nutrient uptake outer membrane protein [Elizabethkingia bruuniana]
MKKNISAAVLAFLLSSCSSDVLNTSPDSTKITTNFYKDADQLEQGVNATYGALQYDGQYQLAMPTIGEIPSDNTFDEVPANDSFTYGEFDFFTIQAKNDLLAKAWRDHYIGIQQANIVLNRITPVAMDSQIKNYRIGEMKFLRALMYFDLVRIFGDVPLSTEETTNVNNYFGKGRNTTTEVYAFIVKELTEAISLLPANVTQKGRATKGAALGILAKVLITNGKYNEAIPYLKQIESLGYSLLPDVNQIFSPTNKNNSEIIFDVQFASGINANSEGNSAFQMFSPSGFVPGAKGHNLPTKEIYNMYSSKDKRRDAYIGLTPGGVPYTKKLVKTSDVIADSGSNVIVLRLAEVYLILAECYAQTGDTANANIYVNKIKTRAGLDNVNISDKNTLLEEIAAERRKELIGEGHRWFDLVRTGKAIEVMTKHFQNTPGYSTAKIQQYNLIMPVPQGQINTDPSIKQNPGY